MVWWPNMDGPKFWIPKNVQFWHICGAFSFWSNFGWPKIWVIPCWVTTPHGCHWLHLTNSGHQLQQWTLFTFKQYCLEGILTKESSTRTKDFLLWSDLHSCIFPNMFVTCIYSVIIAVLATDILASFLTPARMFCSHFSDLSDSWKMFTLQ